MLILRGPSLLPLIAGTLIGLAQAAFALPPDDMRCGGTLEGTALEVSVNPSDLRSVHPDDLIHRKALFTSTFEVHAVGPEPAADVVIERTLRWSVKTSSLTDATRAMIRDQLREHSNVPFIQVLAPAQNLRLATARRSGPPGNVSWAFIRERGDPKNAGLWWRTDVTVTASGPDRARVNVATSTSHEQSNAFEPYTILSSRPGLIDHLLTDDRVELYSGVMPLASTAFVVGSAALAAVRAALVDPDRILPMVLMSRNPVDHRFEGNPDAIANELHGFASVLREGETRVFDESNLGAMHVRDGQVRVLGGPSQDLGLFEAVPGSGRQYVRALGRFVVRGNIERVRAAHERGVTSIFDLL